MMALHRFLVHCSGSITRVAYGNFLWIYMILNGKGQVDCENLVLFATKNSVLNKQWLQQIDNISEDF